MSKVYALNVRFKFDELSCWRVIEVPVNCSMFDLHIILQALFGWFDYHLYDFIYDDGSKRVFLAETRAYDSGFFDEASGGHGAVLRDVEDCSLAEVLEHADVIRYEYDWGDNWQIEIIFLHADDIGDFDVPRCLIGHGDNPPEDVGGESGFIELLEILANEDDAEHADMLAWATYQGYEPFSIDDANDRLMHWGNLKELHLANRRSHQERISHATGSNVINLSDYREDTQEEESMEDILPVLEDAYEREVVARNGKLLDDFRCYLVGSGLKPETIRKHLDNVGFYLNVFLFRDGLDPLADGCQTAILEDFFGYFFICKCMWSTPNSIKATAASLKKFYKCMWAHERISYSDYTEMLAAIKESMPEWQDACRRYNSGESFEDIWGI